MIRKKLGLMILVFLALSISSVQSVSGFLGQHRTCPRCGGIGRDPATLFLTSCPTCGGDGEVGIFMDDEDLEDTLSFLGVGVVIIAAIVGVAGAVIKGLGKPRELLGFPEYESDVRRYFPSCPLCGGREIEVNLTSGGRDTLSCKNCDARWHIYVGLTGLKWAELDVEAKDGGGRELLGIRMEGDEWRKMANKKRAVGYG